CPLTRRTAYETTADIRYVAGIGEPLPSHGDIAAAEVEFFGRIGCAYADITTSGIQKQGLRRPGIVVVRRNTGGVVCVVVLQFQAFARCGRQRAAGGLFNPDLPRDVEFGVWCRRADAD